MYRIYLFEEEVDLDIEKIRVVVKEPNEMAEILEVEDSLKSFQKLVGGLIESVRSVFPEPFSIYINEEGKLLELTPNIVLPYGDWVAGTVVVLAHTEDGGNQSLSEEEAGKIATIVNALGINFIGGIDFGTND